MVYEDGLNAALDSKGIEEEVFPCLTGLNTGNRHYFAITTNACGSSASISDIVQHLVGRINK